MLVCQLLRYRTALALQTPGVKYVKERYTTVQPGGMSRRLRRGGGLLKELDGKKQMLQLGLIQAVVTDSEKAMEKAIKVLKEFPSPPAPEVTGPRLLDFTCKQTNDLLKNDEDKVSLDGEYEKFLSYSPLMAAVEQGKEDKIGMLIEKGASVAFGNKVSFFFLQWTLSKYLKATIFRITIGQFGSN